MSSVYDESNLDIFGDPIDIYPDDDGGGGDGADVGSDDGADTEQGQAAQDDENLPSADDPGDDDGLENLPDSNLPGIEQLPGQHEVAIGPTKTGQNPTVYSAGLSNAPTIAAGAVGQRVGGTAAGSASNFAGKSADSASTFPTWIIWAGLAALALYFTL